MAMVGFAMDSLTGGPYGLYLTTYFWIFCCVRWTLAYFRLSNTFITPMVVAFGVILENLIHLIGTVSLDSFSAGIPTIGFGTFVRQLIWAILTGPMVLFLMNTLYKRSAQWRRRLVVTDRNNL